MYMPVYKHMPHKNWIGLSSHPKVSPIHNIKEREHNLPPSIYGNSQLVKSLNNNMWLKRYLVSHYRDVCTYIHIKSLFPLVFTKGKWTKTSAVWLSSGEFQAQNLVWQVSTFVFWRHFMWYWQYAQQLLYYCKSSFTPKYMALKN